jgi:hypothetical protein
MCAAACICIALAGPTWRGDRDGLLRKKGKLQNSNMNDIVVAESVKKKNLTRDRKMWKEGEILV